MGKCEQEGCKTRAYFNIKGEKGRFCGKHKWTDMVNVKSKRCEEEGCYIEPTFGIKGGKGRF